MSLYSLSWTFHFTEFTLRLLDLPENLRLSFIINISVTRHTFKKTYQADLIDF